MKKRVIVQLLTYDDGELLFALCDDGTLWTMRVCASPEWLRVPDVPQPPKPDVRDVSITELELSVNTLNHLRDMGVRTVGDLEGYSRADLLAHKGFGRRSLYDLIDMLENIGVKLKGER